MYVEKFGSGLNFLNHRTHIGIHGQSDARDATQADLVGDHVSVRASASGYFAALIVGSFFSAFLFYLEMDSAAIALFCFSWICLPILALSDRIVFDGRRLSRSGVLPRLWSAIHRLRRTLRLNDIEQIETSAVRALRRGGNVIYRYRTVVKGKGIEIAFTSGGEDYRRMTTAIFSRVPEHVLDARSVEVRDHLADPKETLMKASFEHIPSADVLRIATRGVRTTSLAEQKEIGETDEARARYLADLANELRLNGYLRQAIEAFRRALVIKPHDARILFDLARCLSSFAGSERSQRLERKAVAAFRLAERRAADDGELLERLGEAYFHAGEWRRARSAFEKALEKAGEGFRSARGLAEIALREGKIAHVIHHFSTANRLADSPSLRRWTRGEAEYFSRLNDDAEYMEMEVGRVSMLETFENIKRTAVRLALLGFPVIMLGVVSEDTLLADTGWAVSAAALVVWACLNIGTRMFATRIPYDSLHTADD